MLHKVFAGDAGDAVACKCRAPARLWKASDIYVLAGLDVAHVWLPGDTTAFNISSRDRARSIMLEPGPALTDRPLVVLVNSRSASASEILAGALHDNHRAQLVGDAPTFGKGRIQSVYELNDGAALFVTVARYQTPLWADIDHVGIRPDVKCRVPRTASLGAYDPTISADGPDSMREHLPVELRAAYGADPAPERLLADPCFLAAGKALAAEVEHPRSLPRFAHGPPILAGLLPGGISK
jgi:carboxyl-terminal processing protease